MGNVFKCYTHAHAQTHTHTCSQVCILSSYISLTHTYAMFLDTLSSQRTPRGRCIWRPMLHIPGNGQKHKLGEWDDVGNHHVPCRIGTDFPIGQATPPAAAAVGRPRWAAGAAGRAARNPKTPYPIWVMGGGRFLGQNFPSPPPPPPWRWGVRPPHPVFLCPPDCRSPPTATTWRPSWRSPRCDPPGRPRPPPRGHGRCAVPFTFFQHRRSPLRLFVPQEPWGRGIGKLGRRHCHKR